MRSIPSILVLVLVLAPFTDAATQQQPIQPGQRVRVTAGDLGVNRQVATFQAVENNVLPPGRLEMPADRQSRLSTADDNCVDM